MELILQQGLSHQQEAVDRINQVFKDVGIFESRNFYENPTIDLSDFRLKQNISVIQSSLPAEYRHFAAPDNCLNLDIKMETGTGKTYVYTKTMFELHKTMASISLSLPCLHLPLKQVLLSFCLTLMPEGIFQIAVAMAQT